MAMNADDACRRLGVSRETREKLEACVATLLEWRGRMNLVGPGTIDDIWERHIVGCARFACLIPSPCRPPGRSRQRRGPAGVSPVLHGCRAESLASEPADVITAGAVAPLERLVSMAARFMAEGSIVILPKGGAAGDELKAVARRRHLWYTRHTSMTDPTRLYPRDRQVVP